MNSWGCGGGGGGGWCLWGNSWRKGAFFSVCIFRNQKMHGYLMSLIFFHKLEPIRTISD